MARRGRVAGRPPAPRLRHPQDRQVPRAAVDIAPASPPAATRSPAAPAPRPMTYVDYEMSEDDLLERLEDMGFNPATSSCSPTTCSDAPPLDTVDGGRTLMRLLERDQSVGVVIDTIGRAVEGEENAADTYHAFWHHTGTLAQAGRDRPRPARPRRPRSRPYPWHLRQSRRRRHRVARSPHRRRLPRFTKSTPACPGSPTSSTSSRPSTR